MTSLAFATGHLLRNHPTRRLPLTCSLGSRECGGSGTALLKGAILLLPSHCPKGPYFLTLFPTFEEVFYGRISKDFIAVIVRRHSAR